MGRVNSVSAKGASVEFSRREVTVTGEDNSENIEINIEVHMDGDMKGVCANISMGWRYAPKEIEVRTIDGVLIPSNRLGGAISVPPRVTDFDSRRVLIDASWEKSMIQKISSEPMVFSVSVDYEKTNDPTILLNTGRGIGGVERKKPEIGAMQIRKANVEYVPKTVMASLAQFRTREFQDNSLHYDNFQSANIFPRFDSYGFNGHFLGFGDQKKIDSTERNSEGIALGEGEGLYDRFCFVLDDIMHQLVLDYDLKGNEKKKLRKNIISSCNWVVGNLEHPEIKSSLEVICWACICLIRSGLSIGGRVGKKFSERGMEGGAFLFAKDVDYITTTSEGGMLVLEAANEEEISTPKLQLLSVMFMIHMKKAGFGIKKKEFDEIISRYWKTLRYFRSGKGFFSNLAHLDNDDYPKIESENRSTFLFMIEDWIRNNL